jgi:hypothetical protein
MSPIEREATRLANECLRDQVDGIETAFRGAALGAVLVFNPVRGAWRLRVASSRQTLDVHGESILDALGQAATVLALDVDPGPTVPYRMTHGSPVETSPASGAQACDTRASATHTKEAPCPSQKETAQEAPRETEPSSTSSRPPHVVSDSTSV